MAPGWYSRRSGGCGAGILLWSDLVEKPLHPPRDVVADTAHGLDVLARRVLELPVLVALAGVDRARVTAAHRYDRVCGPYELIVEGLRELLLEVGSQLGHRFGHRRVDLV